MLIFIQESPAGQIVAVPLNQVLMIKQAENSIFIKVSTGEVDIDGDANSPCVTLPQIDWFTIKFSSEKAAIAEIESFFKACSQNQGAFFFKAV